jgi:hypothetical protein
VAPVATIALPTPTFTATNSGLPPTWTPIPEATQAGQSAGESEATLLPSSTPVPTFTPVILPTFTPSRTPRKAVSSGSCQVANQTPADGSYILKNSDFETHWTIKNTSEILWRSDSIDIRFTSGDRLHTGTDVRDMPYDVAPGGQIEVVVNMHAGDTPGSYTANWALVSGLSPVCSFFVNINVQ